jgi:hypothetical protein
MSVHLLGVFPDDVVVLVHRVLVDRPQHRQHVARGRVELLDVAFGSNRNAAKALAASMFFDCAGMKTEGKSLNVQGATSAEIADRSGR